MKRCRHGTLRLSAWTVELCGDTRTVWGSPAEITTADGRRLLLVMVAVCNCGALLSLGPARDSGEHAAAVAIEVRAAEIAELWHAADPAVAFDFSRRLNHEEIRGWSLAETNMQNHSDRWHAGYLARAITTHDHGGQVTRCFWIRCLRCDRAFAKRALDLFCPDCLAALTAPRSKPHV